MEDIKKSIMSSGSKEVLAKNISSMFDETAEDSHSEEYVAKGQTDEFEKGRKEGMVQKKVTDRNGKTVTKWVKPGSGEAKSGEQKTNEKGEPISDSGKTEQEHRKEAHRHLEIAQEHLRNNDMESYHQAMDMVNKHVEAHKSLTGGSKEKPAEKKKESGDKKSGDKSGGGNTKDKKNSAAKDSDKDKELDLSDDIHQFAGMVAGSVDYKDFNEKTGADLTSEQFHNLKEFEKKIISIDAFDYKEATKAASKLAKLNNKYDVYNLGEGSDTYVLAAVPKGTKVKGVEPMKDGDIE